MTDTVIQSCTWDYMGFSPILTPELIRYVASVCSRILTLLGVKSRPALHLHILLVSGDLNHGGILDNVQ